MTRYGSVAPDLWMQHAVGTDVGADAMIQSAERALQVIR
jgi:hypothetical protein